MTLQLIFKFPSNSKRDCLYQETGIREGSGKITFTKTKVILF